ncbi:phosphatidylglycerophosphatase A [Denitrobaculum tricleocarpae]|uniref:Phosphatidylglycerophosphatase A n=1 Tax=Denitrobaculum tricleocarpae TaxID=2591009 RepID=A0A545TQB4_9PROT|nr:phosphatidylglycerophosphatase A [Denitrobaculum tricleocarpae]TQV79397.1 phosphatidylglycerophosphatase A [Denitrobaculum tricleocarpae]
MATWLGSGLLPKIPGTWGSLAALPFAAALAWLGGPWLLAVAAVLVFLVGIWASDVYARRHNLEDPGAVVVDEVAGQWLTLVPVALQLEYYLLAFVLFRVFDILKPWPVSWADRKLKGGFGIMVDDIFAAVYALAVLIAAVWVLESQIVS